MNRPILIPGLPRVWRGPRELQLGADPSRALSVQLPDPRAAQILDLLDGIRSERAVLLRAAELGVPLQQAQALLGTLQAAGLVLPAPALLPSGLPHESRRRLISEAAALALTARPPAARPTDARPPAARPTDAKPTDADNGAADKDAADKDAAAGKMPADILRRRADCRVVLTGHGRLGAPIAVALAEAGVGAVEADLPGLVTPGELAGGPLRGTDLGRPRREAISDAVLRAAPGLRSHSVRDPAATLVVPLNQDGPPGVPHLAVTIREGTPVIGPLVPASGRPCLHCLDLHRQDRDAGWPGSPGRLLPEAAQPCTVAVVLAATAFATAEVLTHLDGGRPQTLGTAVEIIAPGRTRRRRWPPHPACRCAGGPNHSRH